MTTFRLWAAAAWADEVLHPSESSALLRYLETCDLSDAEKDAARDYFVTNPAVSLDEVRSLPAEARAGVYRAALGIVRLDQKVVELEQDFLGRLRSVLDLDGDTLRRIEAEFPPAR